MLYPWLKANVEAFLIQVLFKTVRLFVDNVSVFFAVIILVFDLTNIKSLHNTK